jgi:hypothetical protein
MITPPNYTKRYHCHIATVRKNVEDNLKPAIDLLHSGN